MKGLLTPPSSVLDETMTVAATSPAESAVHMASHLHQQHQSSANVTNNLSTDSNHKSYNNNNNATINPRQASVMTSPAASALDSFDSPSLLPDGPTTTAQYGGAASPSASTPLYHDVATPSEPDLAQHSAVSVVGFQGQHHHHHHQLGAFGEGFDGFDQGDGSGGADVKSPAVFFGGDFPLLPQSAFGDCAADLPAGDVALDNMFDFSSFNDEDEDGTDNHSNDHVDAGGFFDASFVAAAATDSSSSGNKHAAAASATTRADMSPAGSPAAEADSRPDVDLFAAASTSPATSSIPPQHQHQHQLQLQVQHSRPQQPQRTIRFDLDRFDRLAPSAAAAPRAHRPLDLQPDSGAFVSDEHGLAAGA
ncbi:hypothetical protein BDY21DRAFT_342640 [Lineolata rhizophorae]|uniref:Uncharacterized protein n=1 Tax=Lineolata rhizophorae TaxID=578093 RepID=A0A6A6P1T5_9PEZI|nr:hypothetical protein BDY21DRAFT_342640 [Lineolata rhizophorae]